MPDLDAEIASGRWPRVGGTAAGGYFEIEPRVLVAVPRPGYVQTAADARGSMTEFQRIAAQRGGPTALIILVDRVVSQDSEGRKVWADADPELFAGLALVCSSALARAIGTFFIGLRRPSYPLAMVPSLDAAIAWCRRCLGEE